MNFSGSIMGVNTTEIELTLNGVASTVPVNESNLTTTLNFSALNTVNLNATDYNGTIWTDTLYYDGDHLSGSDEIRYGFDPMNPDSDCTYTVANEAGNGTPDGYEKLNGDQLPIGVKVRMQANPFVPDTDGDGLTDYFKLVKMGLYTISLISKSIMLFSCKISCMENPSELNDQEHQVISYKKWYPKINHKAAGSLSCMIKGL